MDSSLPLLCLPRIKLLGYLIYSANKTISSALLFHRYIHTQCTLSCAEEERGVVVVPYEDDDHHHAVDEELKVN